MARVCRRIARTCYERLLTLAKGLRGCKIDVFGPETPLFCRGGLLGGPLSTREESDPLPGVPFPPVSALKPKVSKYITIVATSDCKGRRGTSTVDVKSDLWGAGDAEPRAGASGTCRGQHPGFGGVSVCADGTFFAR